MCIRDRNNILRSQINIYPNPASQILFIDYSGNENLFLEIINISGEIIFTDQLKQIINTIDISKFIAGVYVCLLYTSDAADERSSVDLGGRRIIKKKKKLVHRAWRHVSVYKE